MKKVSIICKKGTTTPARLTAFLKKEEKIMVKDAQKADIVIVFGGDGTILKAVQLLNGKPTPILGVKTGGLGILTQIEPHRLISALKKVFAEKCRLDRRTLLEVEINSEKTGFALNEAAIGQGPFTRLINFKIHAGRKKLDFCANGVIIATPTGSTAYSCSAGGPILKPAARSLLITPICPSFAKQKPVKIPDTSKIKITLARYHNPAQNLGLSLDGQKNIRIKYKDKIRIRKARQKAHFIIPSI